MKVVFMGTPHFALPSLWALLDHGYQVLAVVTQPDRRSGRGNKLRPSPVKIAALEAGLPVHQPQRMDDPVFGETLKRLAPDIIAVAAFGQILPQAILKMPRFGCVNVHASFLPGYRGAGPIHRVVMNGEQETGVTIMQMDAGLDNGDMLVREKIAIGPDDTTGEVHDKLAVLGGKLLVKALALIENGQVKPIPQDENKSSYAPMLQSGDEIIDWRCSAAVIKNKIRGLNPWPGARTTLNGKLLKIWRAHVAPKQWLDAQADWQPGQIIGVSDEGGIGVHTGEGVLVIEELQLQGKKRMETTTFLRGRPLSPGAILGATQGDGGDLD